MIRFYFFAIVFLTNFSLLSAQVVKDTIGGWAIIQKADSLRSAESYDQAVTTYKKAIALYSKGKAWEQVAMAQNKIATNYYFNDQEDLQLKYAQTALATLTNKFKKKSIWEAEAYNHLGHYANYKKQFSVATNHYKKALKIAEELNGNVKFPKFINFYYTSLQRNYTQIKDYKTALIYAIKSINMHKVTDKESVNYGWALYEAGNLYYLQGMLKKAISTYLAALKPLTSNYGKDHERVIGTYSMLSNCYSELFEFEKALENEILVLEYFKNTNDVYNVGIVSMNVGVEYTRLRKFELAEKYLNDALILFSRNPNKYSYEIADVELNIGKMLDDQLQFQNAISKYNVSLREYLKINDKNGLAIVYQNIGDSYYKLKNYSSALKFTEKALSLLIELYGSNHPKVAESYKYLGNIFFAKKEYEKAIIYLKKGLKSNLNKITKTTISYHYNFLLLHSLARVYKELYFKERKTVILDESLKLYKNASEIIPIIRRDLTSWSDNKLYTATLNQFYSEVIQLCLESYAVNKKHSTLKQSYNYAVQSKGQSLIKSLNQNEIITSKVIPDSIITFQNSLQKEQASLRSKIALSHNNNESYTAQIDLVRVSAQLDSLNILLERNYPAYSKIITGNSEIKIEELQKKLGEKSSLLEYFSGTSKIYAFLFTHDNFQIFTIDKDKLNISIANFQKAILSSDIKAFKKESEGLYEKLIAPIKNQLNTEILIIVPDNKLWQLDFDLLLTKNTNTNNPNKMPYLLKNHAISYLSSSKFLFKENSPNNTFDKQSCLAFSYSNRNTVTTSNTKEKSLSLKAFRNTTDDLPGTRKEIKKIAKLLDGSYYYGNMATEANFKKHAPNYSILHLALHGELNHENPKKSKLIFTKSADTIEDNQLYIHELATLKLPAKLAILSACNTGSGETSSGEGIMSLGNAFRMAGVQSLLLSRWKISDKTTPLLMEYFYENLKKGMRKSIALQQAKIKFLNNAKKTETFPIYWSGFYILGNNNAMNFNTNTTIYYWLIGLLVVSLSVIFLFLKKYN